MVNVANYVEFKVKALIKELAENFDIRKCGELYQSVGDLLKLESESEFKKTGFIVPNGGPIPDPIVDVVRSAVGKAQEPPPQENSDSTEAVLKTWGKEGDHRPDFGQIFRRVKVRED